ncbi:MAG: ABC transporter ATP-binding protein [Planctomycetota bacterium]|nr:MAG: ABC transporter ATP-binding protein [Planctomycetota bacterium]
MNEALSSPDDDVVVRTRGLTRRFGRSVAVSELSIEVRRGDVFGFLGPNGAGKTTTIRMLLGLLRPSAGEIELFGRPLHRDRLRLLAQVGALVEQPAFYPWLTGRENLRAFGYLTGARLGAGRIEEVLELVGLAGRADDRVAIYSQGMRQRLGIAQALLARPRLVFLDEPTNGLDPPGIEHIRSLLLRLAREHGVTVFVSSHLLHEVERMCNRVAILDRGRLVVSGEVGALLGGDGTIVEIETHAVERAAALLADTGYRVLGTESDRLRVRADRTQVAAIARLLCEHDVGLEALVPRRPSLEDFFRERLEGPAVAEAVS